MALIFRLGILGRQAGQLIGIDFNLEQDLAPWKRLKNDINGATAIEYGLLAGLIAVGLAGGLGALADLVNLLFEIIGDETAGVTDSMVNP